MARSDEPGFRPPTPSFPGGFDAHADAMSAPGTEGVSASSTAGAEVGRPVVSIPGMSSQLPGGRPTLAVLAGDTAGMADDLGAHQSVIAPGPQGDYLSTGAGSGSPHDPHPNAVNVPGLAAQAENARRPS